MWWECGVGRVDNLIVLWIVCQVTRSKMANGKEDGDHLELPGVSVSTFIDSMFCKHVVACSVVVIVCVRDLIVVCCFLVCGLSRTGSVIVVGLSLFVCCRFMVLEVSYAINDGDVIVPIVVFDVGRIFVTALLLVVIITGICEDGVGRKHERGFVNVKVRGVLGVVRDGGGGFLFLVV